MRKSLILAVVVAVALTCSWSLAANRGVSFNPMGFIENPGPFPASIPYYMTSDGTMVTGSLSPYGSAPFLWTADTGFTYIGPGGLNMSRSGDSIMGNYYDGSISAAGVWLGGENWAHIDAPDNLAPCGSSYHSIHGAGNGGIATGLTWEGCSYARGFYYDGANSWDLDSMNGDSSRGNDIADDGTIVGWTRWDWGMWRGAIYTQDGGWDWIDGLGNDLVSGTPEYFAGIKGEAADISPNGRYVLGQNFGDSDWTQPDYDPTLWGSAYIWDRMTGEFTQLSPPETGSPYDSWTAFNISDDGSAAVGRYGWWIFSFPVLWTQETGTLDLQWFLIGQGLDDLWFWYLTDATDINADGSMLIGAGQNENFWIEGYTVNLTKASVCHKPDGNERTLTVNWDSLGDHLGHGDDLATCEFMRSGARSRFGELRPQAPTHRGSQVSPDHNNSSISFSDIVERNPKYAGAKTTTEAPVLQLNNSPRARRARTRAMER